MDLESLISAWEPHEDALSVDVDHLDHFYGSGDTKKQVLFDNCLKIYPGEIVIMTGPSGSGKTTLLTLVGTLRNVQHGSLRILGHELKGVNQDDSNILRKSIGFIFQAHNLFESLTAFQNVQMSTELQGIPMDTARPKIDALLTRLDLGKRIQYKPKSLSGGQKQRVAVARGLIHQPKLVLADEPTAALDAKSGREVVTIFQELAKEHKSTILIVTHDDRILDVADRIVRMEDGYICSNVLVRRNALTCKVLHGFDIFKSLTPQVISNVAEKVKLKRYAAGEVIIQQGDVGEEFFVIGMGEVDIEIDGKQIKQMGQGAFFGEKSLVENQPRSATVRARTQVACFVLSKDAFQSAIESSATFEEELRKAIFTRR